jgi:hypothetical protein
MILYPLLLVCNKPLYPSSQHDQENPSICVLNSMTDNYNKITKHLQIIYSYIYISYIYIYSMCIMINYYGEIADVGT